MKTTADYEPNPKKQKPINPDTSKFGMGFLFSLGGLVIATLIGLGFKVWAIIALFIVAIGTLILYTKHINALNQKNELEKQNHLKQIQVENHRRNQELRNQAKTIEQKDEEISTQKELIATLNRLLADRTAENDARAENNAAEQRDRRIQDCINWYYSNGKKQPVQLIDTYHDLSPEEKARLLDDVIYAIKGKPAQSNKYRDQLNQ